MERFLRQRRVSLIQRIIASGLSLVIFCTQVLFANAPEKSVWEQRRQAINHLPGLSVLPVNKKSHPQSSLADLISSLSVDGVVRNVRSGKESSPVVVHIQDVHGQPEAQKNISSMVLKILDAHPSALVGLEGTAGRIPIENFREGSFDINKEVGSFFLNTGLITGAEYAGFAAKTEPHLFGVEDRDLYLKNVEAVRAALPLQKEKLAQIEKEKIQLQLKKQSVYSSEMMALDQKWRGYHDGTLSVGDYLTFLVRHSRFRGDDGINLFLKTWSLEKSLNFEKAERERNQILYRLVEKLSKPEIDHVVAQSKALRSRALSYPNYYRFLKDSAVKAGLSFDATPEFERYLTYVSQSDQIRPEELLTEVSQYEKEIWDALCKTPEHRELVKISTKLMLTEKLVRLTLTPREWGEYKSQFTERNNTPGLVPLPVRGGGRGGAETEARAQKFDLSFKNGRETPPLSPPLTGRGTIIGGSSSSPFEEFYAIAEARNTALSSNLEKELSVSRSKIAVLVAGGFHSEGLNELLGKENLTLITVAPKLTPLRQGFGGQAHDNEYLNVFTREKTPLEKLFETPKISIVMTPALHSIRDERGNPVNPTASFVSAIVEPLRRVIERVAIAGSASYTLGFIRIDGAHGDGKTLTDGNRKLVLKGTTTGGTDIHISKNQPQRPRWAGEEELSTADILFASYRDFWFSLPVLAPALFAVSLVSSMGGDLGQQLSEGFILGTIGLLGALPFYKAWHRRTHSKDGWVYVRWKLLTMGAGSLLLFLATYGFLAFLGESVFWQRLERGLAFLLGFSVYQFAHHRHNKRAAHHPQKAIPPLAGRGKHDRSSGRNPRDLIYKLVHPDGRSIRITTEADTDLRGKAQLIVNLSCPAVFFKDGMSRKKFQTDLNQITTVFEMGIDYSNWKNIGPLLAMAKQHRVSISEPKILRQIVMIVTRAFFQSSEDGLNPILFGAMKDILVSHWKKTGLTDSATPKIEGVFEFQTFGFDEVNKVKARKSMKFETNEFVELTSRYSIHYHPPILRTLLDDWEKDPNLPRKCTLFVHREHADVFLQVAKKAGFEIDSTRSQDPSLGAEAWDIKHEQWFQSVPVALWFLVAVFYMANGVNIETFIHLALITLALVLIPAFFFILTHNPLIRFRNDLFRHNDGTIDHRSIWSYRWYLFHRHLRFTLAMLSRGPLVWLGHKHAIKVHRANNIFFRWRGVLGAGDATASTPGGYPRAAQMIQTHIGAFILNAPWSILRDESDNGKKTVARALLSDLAADFNFSNDDVEQLRAWAPERYDRQEFETFLREKIGLDTRSLQRREPANIHLGKYLAAFGVLFDEGERAPKAEAFVRNIVEQTLGAKASVPNNISELRQKYRLRADRAIAFWPKAVLYKGPKSDYTKSLRHGETPLEDSHNQGSIDKISSALALIDEWVRQKKNEAVEDESLKDFIDNLEWLKNVVTIVEVDSPLPLLFTDVAQNVARSINIGRSRLVLYVPRWFLGDFDLENTDDMRELAVHLLHRLEWCWKYNKLTTSKVDEQTIRATMNAHSEGFTQRDRYGLVTPDAIRDRHFRLAKRELVVESTTLVPRILYEYRELLKAITAVETQYPTMYDPTTAVRESREDLLNLAQRARRLGMLYQIVGEDNFSDGFFRISDYFIRLIQKNDSGELPVALEWNAMEAALRAGDLTGFLNHFQMLLTGEGFQVSPVLDAAGVDVQLNLARHRVLLAANYLRREMGRVFQSLLVIEGDEGKRQALRATQAQANAMLARNERRDGEENWDKESEPRANLQTPDSERAINELRKALKKQLIDWNHLPPKKMRQFDRLSDDQLYGMVNARSVQKTLGFVSGWRSGQQDRIVNIVANYRKQKIEHKFLDKLIDPSDVEILNRIRAWLYNEYSPRLDELCQIIVSNGSVSFDTVKKTLAPAFAMIGLKIAPAFVPPTTLFTQEDLKHMADEVLQKAFIPSHFVPITSPFNGEGIAGILLPKRTEHVTTYMVRTIPAYTVYGETDSSFGQGIAFDDFVLYPLRMEMEYESQIPAHLSSWENIGKAKAQGRRIVFGFQKDAYLFVTWVLMNIFGRHGKDGVRIIRNVDLAEEIAHSDARYFKKSLIPRFTRRGEVLVQQTRLLLRAGGSFDRQLSKLESPSDQKAFCEPIDEVEGKLLALAHSPFAALTFSEIVVPLIQPIPGESPHYNRARKMILRTLSPFLLGGISDDPFAWLKFLEENAQDIDDLNNRLKHAALIAYSQEFLTTAERLKILADKGVLEKDEFDGMLVPLEDHIGAETHANPRGYVRLIWNPFVLLRSVVVGSIILFHEARHWAFAKILGAKPTFINWHTVKFWPKSPEHKLAIIRAGPWGDRIAAVIVSFLALLLFVTFQDSLPLVAKVSVVIISAVFTYYFWKVGTKLSKKDLVSIRQIKRQRALGELFVYPQGAFGWTDAGQLEKRSSKVSVTDITAEADRMMFGNSSRDVAQEISELIGHLQTDLLKAEFDFSGAEGILYRRFTAQMRYAKDAVNEKKNIGHVRPLLTNAANLAGRAGFSVRDTDRALKALWQRTQKRWTRFILWVYWFTGWTTQHVINGATQMGMSLRDAEFSSGGVIGFHMDVLMDDGLRGSEAGEETLKLLRRRAISNGRDREPDVLFVRYDPDKQNEEAAENALQNELEKLGAEFATYGRACDIVAVPTGLISPEQVLRYAKKDWRMEDIKSIRFDIYTATPDQFDLHNSLVRFILYSILADGQIMPVSDQVETARVISVGA